MEQQNDRWDETERREVLRLISERAAELVKADPALGQNDAMKRAGEDVWKGLYSPRLTFKEFNRRRGWDDEHMAKMRAAKAAKHSANIGPLFAQKNGAVTHSANGSKSNVKPRAANAPEAKADALMAEAEAHMQAMAEAKAKADALMAEAEAHMQAMAEAKAKADALMAEAKRREREPVQFNGEYVSAQAEDKANAIYRVRGKGPGRIIVLTKQDLKVANDVAERVERLVAEEVARALKMKLGA